MCIRDSTDTAQIIELLAQRASAGDTVVIMSSGSFENLHDRLLNRLGDAVLPCAPSDYPKVKKLLDHVKLPTAGVPESLAELWVLKDGQGDVMGCVALEIYGDTALLRSLACLLYTSRCV